MQIGRGRGSQKKVSSLIRQVDEMDKRAADYAAKAKRERATPGRPGEAHLPAGAPGEVVASRPEGESHAPSIGWQRSGCVDVHDEGIVETKYGPRHQVEFCWELEEERPEGGRFHVWRKFTLSLSDTSTLRKFLEVWQGYPFAAHELKTGVPLAERFVRRDGLLLIEAYVNPETGKTYRNVRAGYPLPVKAPRFKFDGTYIRKAYRRKKKGGVDDGASASVGSGDAGGGEGVDGRADRPADGDGVGHGAAEAIGTVPEGGDRRVTLHAAHDAWAQRGRVGGGEGGQ